MKRWQFVLIVIFALMLGGSIQKWKCDSFFPEMGTFKCMLFTR